MKELREGQKSVWCSEPLGQPDSGKSVHPIKLCGEAVELLVNLAFELVPVMDAALDLCNWKVERTWEASWRRHRGQPHSMVDSDDKKPERSKVATNDVVLFKRDWLPFDALPGMAVPCFLSTARPATAPFGHV
jgi:hypothetical protein